MAAFGTGPLLLCSAGLVLVCLFRTPLRLAGAALIGCAIVIAIRTPQPDVLVMTEGHAFAVRGADGRLAMIKSGSDTFAFREWLMADADPRAPKDKTLGEGIRCDAAGCIGRLADGALVAIANSAEAFEEDCRRAAVVLECAPARRPIAPRSSSTARRCGGPAPWRCVAQGRGSRLRSRGPQATTGPGRRPPADLRTLPASSSLARPRDATPNVEDLEPGD